MRTDEMPADEDSAAASKVTTALTAPAVAGWALTSTWAYATPPQARAPARPRPIAPTRRVHLAILRPPPPRLFHYGIWYQRGRAARRTVSQETPYDEGRAP